MSQPDELNSVALRVRKKILGAALASRTPHIGSSLSVVEILVSLLGSVAKDPVEGDSRIILSKGHAALALYAIFSEFGILSDDEMATFAQVGGLLEEHPTHLVRGVPNPSGSLGHGLPFASGLVLASNLMQRPITAYVVMSDGECNEGTVWEAAIFCAAKSLTGVVVIVDQNEWQATGPISETFGPIKIGEMFKAAHWDVAEIDGHDAESLISTLMAHKKSGERPLCIIARTTKGKGISFMENDNNWHYRVLDQEDYLRASEELKLQL